jgi:hypothetical protein
MKLNRDNSDLSDKRPDGQTTDRTVVADGLAQSQVQWNRAKLRDEQLNPVELQELALEPEWQRLWRVCHSRWRLLACVVVVSGLSVFILTTRLMVPKYQATALLRPNQQQSSGLAGLAGAVLGSTSSSSGGGLASLLGGGNGNGITTHDPQELIAILQSYAFTDSLVSDNHLASKITRKRNGLILWLLGPHHPTHWKLYRIMSRRFDCDFSVRTGNLTMSFVDKDPALARFVLKQYVDRLRSQLRKQDVQESRVAVQSLEAQAHGTSDPVLAAQLYGLVAQQLQQEGSAQMSADYAFEVIEPPVVPDEVYSPWPLLDMSAAVVVSFLALLFFLYAKDRFRSSHREVIMAMPASLRSGPNGIAEREEGPEVLRAAD